jgi:glyoxylase-like metal-dependent hydrolase (beta-lactamase superfamily II)/rhodanese-related sulfurtransferase
MTALREKEAITAFELYELLAAGQPAFALLDVRNDEDFAAWKIEGPHQPAAHLHIPYFDFLEDEEASLARLTGLREMPVVVVCAKGGSSEYVATLLRDHGFHAVNLEDGMVGWGNLVVEVDVPTGTPLLIKQIQRVGKGCLAYFIADGEQAIVVDPHRHITFYQALAERLNVRITHVFDTHLHADHISGGRLLADATGAQYLIEAHDAEGARFAYEPVQAGSSLTLGHTEIKMMPLFTPGHTPGSASMLIDGRFLISGDTLFVASIGRPDLGGKMAEWGKMLFKTVGPGGAIASLPDDVLILPAHFAGVEERRADGIVAGNLGELRTTNAALKLTREEDFVAFLEANQREAPAIYHEIRKVNLAWDTVDEARATEMDLGKNECAASKAAAAAQ